MKTITTISMILFFGFVSQHIIAQESLEQQIERQVKEQLRADLEKINEAIELNNMTIEEAAAEKERIAESYAIIIERRLDSSRLAGDIAKMREDQNHKTSRSKYYHRKWFTKSDLVVALGFNNAISDGGSLNDSPYKFGGSRFFELGWAYKSRISKTPNVFSLKYGISLQFNGLKPTDNQYFVQNGNETSLDVFPLELRKSKLTITNLVAPVHFEFGSSQNRFKIGLGGYAGFNIGTRQKLKYTREGDRVKDKIKRSYNASNIVYGLSGYCAFGETAVYLKYDINPLFKNQTVSQRNISLGVRFDMD
jgi:hypothetical protein